MVYGQATNEPHQTGTVIISDSITGILGSEAASNFSDIVDLDQVIKWQLHVPENYHPNKSIGVIYNSYYYNLDRTPIGWRTSFEEKNLIEVSRIYEDGIRYPHTIAKVLAIALIQRYYNIDSNRIYIITGLRGCGRATQVALSYPNIIKGVIFDQCTERFNRLENLQLQGLILQNRFVFMAPSKSQKSLSTRRNLKAFKNAGITNTKYFAYSSGRINLTRAQLNQSIDYLDDASQN